MNLERVKDLRCKLSIHLGVLAVLTAMLVANGTGTLFLPAFIAFVCVLSYIGVDRQEWFALGQVLAAISMVVATAIAVGGWFYSSFVSDSQSGQLLAIAGLLVYPEAVLFLQRKNLRIFEQLAVFLLLEMVVAALVNDNLLFGLLLAPIILLWVSSLFLFSRYATLVGIDPSIETPTRNVVEILFAMVWRRVMGEQRPEVVETRLLPGFEVLRSPWIRRGLQSVPIGVGALVFAGVFFYLTPRTNPISLGASLTSTTSMVGLPDFLSFGQFGTMLQDETQIMRVSFFSSKSGDPFCPLSPPYLRARVFDRYVSANERRKRSDRGWGYLGIPREDSRRLSDFKEAEGSSGFRHDPIEVEFDIKKEYGKQLFTVPPSRPARAEQSIPLRYDPLHMTFKSLDESARSRRKSIVYRTSTTGFQGAEQTPVTPVEFGRNMAPEDQIDELDGKLQRGFSQLRRANAFRLDLLNEMGLSEDRPLQLALGMTRYLAESGEFQYSLNLSPPSDADMDVVEDFLMNQRSGHCQYFASALACLLRQSGVPCRMVIGYRPSEYNKIGEYFTVRQKDAHAWVEALIHRKDLEGTGYSGFLREEDYYWVRLDPTPALGQPDEIQEQSGQAMDFAEKLWQEYVVDGQKLRSNGSLYDPVSKSDSQFSGFIARSQQFIDDIKTGRLRLSVDFAWQIFLLILAVGFLGVALVYSVKVLPRWAPAFAKRLGLMPTPLESAHPFYARCLALLAKLGLRRQASKTPLEHVKKAMEVLRQQGQSAEGALNYLTELYYRLRFGKDSELTEEELEAVQSHLDVVEHAVMQANMERIRSTNV